MELQKKREEKSIRILCPSDFLPFWNTKDDKLFLQWSTPFNVLTLDIHIDPKVLEEYQEPCYILEVEAYKVGLQEWLIPDGDVILVDVEDPVMIISKHKLYIKPAFKDILLFYDYITPFNITEDMKKVMEEIEKRKEQKNTVLDMEVIDVEVIEEAKVEEEEGKVKGKQIEKMEQ